MTGPLYLSQEIDQHFRGETIRLAIPLGSLDPATVSAVDFALEQESAVPPVRATASLVGSVTPGGNGVQVIPATAVDPQPVTPLDPAALVYEAVIESATAPLPAGWYRFECWLTLPFGRRVVAAGRLHLREPALT